MNKVIAFVIGAMCAALLTTSAAAAAPSNKNTQLIRATCNGRSITLSTVHKRNETADIGSAAPVVGGGSVKVASLTVYELGTTNVVATFTSHYGGPVNANCTGQLTDDAGTLYDFAARVHLTGA